MGTGRAPVAVLADGFTVPVQALAKRLHIEEDVQFEEFQVCGMRERPRGRGVWYEGEAQGEGCVCCLRSFRCVV